MKYLSETALSDNKGQYAPLLKFPKFPNINSGGGAIEFGDKWWIIELVSTNKNNNIKRRKIYVSVVANNAQDRLTSHTNFFGLEGNDTDLKVKLKEEADGYYLYVKALVSSSVVSAYLVESNGDNFVEGLNQYKFNVSETNLDKYGFGYVEEDYSTTIRSLHNNIKVDANKSFFKLDKANVVSFYIAFSCDNDLSSATYLNIIEFPNTMKPSSSDFVPVFQVIDGHTPRTYCEIGTNRQIKIRQGVNIGNFYITGNYRIK